MAKKIDYRINIDKLRVCFTQPDTLIQYLSERKGEDGFVDYEHFRLHIIEEETEDGSSIRQIIARVILLGTGQSGTDVSLGTFMLNNSGKYRGLCFFTFENKALYSCEAIINGERHNLIGYLNYVTETLGLRYNNITELELAMDTNYNVTSVIRRYISKYQQYRMYLNGKIIRDPKITIKGYIEIFNRTRKKLQRTPSLYIKQGSIGIELQLKIYNKTKEIEEESPHKQHINEWNNFADGTQTYRLEVTIGNVDFKEWQRYLESIGSIWKDNEQPLEMLMMEDYRLELWRYATNRMLWFIDINDKESKKITLADIVGGARP